MTMGAVLIGRMIWKKIRPVTGAIDHGRFLDLLADAEEELPQEEDRERRHQENGRMIPGIVLSSPRFLIRTKFGSIVKIGGTISAVRNRKNTCPGPASAAGRTRRPPSRRRAPARA